MVIFITGPDSFLAKRAIDQVKKKYLARNADGAELIELTTESAISWADLLAVPLFANSRLVIIRSIGRFPTENQDSLNYFIKNIPETTVLVLWDEKELPAKSGLLATVVKSAQQTISVASLTGKNLQIWLVKRAKEQGITITAEQTSAVLERCGSDLWAMENELIFLANSKGNLSERTRTEEVEKFGAFRLVRARKWLELAQFVRAEIDLGLPIELIIGGLASAIRQNVTDKSLKSSLTDLLIDIDWGLKTGLLDEEAAGVFLISYLPKPMTSRVQWERIWEEVTF